MSDSEQQEPYVLGKTPKVIKRRKKVLRMRYVRYWPIEQIAGALKVGVRTVERDLQAIEEYGQHIGADVMKESAEKTVWRILENYRERQMLRWQEITTAESQRIKAGLINDVASDEERHFKLLQSIGVVPKAADKIEAKITGDRIVDDPESIRLASALFQRLGKGDAGGPG